ncbi:pilus assembly protein [Aurantiacibacter sp. MUD11]|uniref:TadE family protein n=1 Tax=Aurantiacibacter sp. MUD11 TaxID=3003265 RepID=UPI0022AAE6C3|nr:TadE family protein [Aurantiacibacter sp. MUD11]WAT16710.1 pilus assembly protein [Aurantiacibacter sp. MUD11]
MSALRIWMDAKGAAAAEMALILPVVMALLFGGFEIGHFIWNQHKLTEAVRNGARFASRLPIEDFCIGGSPVMSGATQADIKRVTRTGQLGAGGVTAIPGWVDEELSVQVDCAAFVDTGIYSDLDTAGPIVTVEAHGVGYPSLFGRVGVIDPGITMTARSSAAVTGL